MTTREINKNLIKPVLRQLNDDFRIVKGNFLIKYPVKDILTGFCFERSSDINDFYVWFFAQPLYQLDNIIYLSYGDRIKNKNGVAWSFADKQFFSKNTIEELISAINNNLGFVDEMRDPEQFYSYMGKRLKKFENWRFDETLVYTAFWLKKPNAKNDAIALVNYIENNENISLDWVKHCRDSLNELIDSDNPHVILSRNKEQTILNLKL